MATSLLHLVKQSKAAMMRYKFSIHTGIPGKMCCRHHNAFVYEQLGARTLLGAPGFTTRSKKLLGAPGIATRSKDATRGSWPYY